ncbi:hypothetical protein WN944_027237 [Citrus x changshan-huyou]|uniref:Uncharacterized protein n=2 Tax=Citrus TaxID=2706 RepID=A0A067EGD7_CITSI|nr:hypothetical protein CISIN_1g036851mg [Citrus sinensis]
MEAARSRLLAAMVLLFAILALAAQTCSGSSRNPVRHLPQSHHHLQVVKHEEGRMVAKRIPPRSYRVFAPVSAISRHYDVPLPPGARPPSVL